jgi:hypothetical protein
MNASQRLLLIAALVAIGLVLAFVTLDWNEGWRGGTKVFVFYEKPLGMTSQQWGLYTQFGVGGIILGVATPLCLFAMAAFIALGTKRT